MAFKLEKNFPNPFNPSTTISFFLAKNTHISLKVYDTLGREVATQVSGYRSTRQYKITFYASHLSAGVYLYRLEAGEAVKIKKMILAK